MCWKLYLAPLANNLSQYGYHLKCKAEKSSVYVLQIYRGNFLVILGIRFELFGYCDIAIKVVSKVVC